MLMKSLISGVILVFVLIVGNLYAIQVGDPIHIVETAEETGKTWSVLPDVKWSTKLSVGNKAPVLTLDLGTKYQTLTGFGGAFTESAAATFAELDNSHQEELLEAYWGVDGLGYSLGRLTIGSCDFSLSSYNYNDHKDDYLMGNFSIDHDQSQIIPFIKKAIETKDKTKSLLNTNDLNQHPEYKYNVNVNSDLNFLASPWSPPGWMKKNKKMKNSAHIGLLQDDAIFQAYALYLSKYISAYKDEASIDISYLTIQNEPHVAGQFMVIYECCGFDGPAERDFLKNYLGPQLRKDHPELKILIHDDQKDIMMDFVTAIMDDTEAAQYVDGIAFHWYGSFLKNYQDLADVHEKYPSIPLYATEATLEKPWLQKVTGKVWEQGSYYGVDIIGDLTNGAQTWFDWNLVLEKDGGPSQQHLGPVGNLGACDAPIRADIDKQELIYGVSYYYMGHFSKFILPNRARVDLSSTSGKLDVANDNFLYVAFLSPDEKRVTIVVQNRDDKNEQNFILDLGEQYNLVASLKIAKSGIQTLYFDL